MPTQRTSHPAAPERSRDQEEAARIAEASPEGVPAHPEAGPRQIGLLLAGVVVALLAIALVIAVAWSPVVGIVLGGFGLLLFVCNPAVWAAALRAEERREVFDTDRDGHRG